MPADRLPRATLDTLRDLARRAGAGFDQLYREVYGRRYPLEAPADEAPAEPPSTRRPVNV